MRTKYLIITSAVLLLAGCGEPVDEEECLAVAGDVLLPLAEGNYWNYEQTAYSNGQPDLDSVNTFKLATQKMMTVQFEDTNYLAGPVNLTTTQETFIDPGEIGILFWNGPYGLYQMGGMTKTDTLITKHLALKYPVEEGESWQGQIPGLVWSWSGDASFEEEGFTLSFTCVATSDTIETPVKTFECVVYHYYGPAVWSGNGFEHQFICVAPGVGAVAALSYSIDDPAFDYSSRDDTDLTSKIMLHKYCLK